MRRSLSATLLLLLVLTLGANAKKGRAHKGKHERPQHLQCTASETVYGKCVPDEGDCGDGLREATCKEQTSKIQCKIPCNWRKEISDCKYKFSRWGECDSVTNTKSRSGTLKKALYNAECQPTVTVSKPCSHKPKRPKGGRRLD
ncbi:midkine [Solea senegalensis]|uniref:Midkine n=1 Tax=Solea senegalensis TaxID=28829 RepID=A0AAV6T2H8_SOLSE|nr:midkine b [Solea senegalensis]KAG7523536.1 midkine [Solea senegalensis]